MWTWIFHSWGNTPVSTSPSTAPFSPKAAPPQVSSPSMDSPPNTISPPAVTPTPISINTPPLSTSGSSPTLASPAAAAVASSLVMAPPPAAALPAGTRPAHHPVIRPETGAIIAAAPEDEGRPRINHTGPKRVHFIVSSKSRDRNVSIGASREKIIMPTEAQFRAMNNFLRERISEGVMSYLVKLVPDEIVSAPTTDIAPAIEEAHDTRLGPALCAIPVPQISLNTIPDALTAVPGVTTSSAARGFAGLQTPLDTAPTRHIVTSSIYNAPAPSNPRDKSQDAQLMDNVTPMSLGPQIPLHAAGMTSAVRATIDISTTFQTPSASIPTTHAANIVSISPPSSQDSAIETVPSQITSDIQHLSYAAFDVLPPGFLNSSHRTQVARDLSIFAESEIFPEALNAESQLASSQFLGPPPPYMTSEPYTAPAGAAAQALEQPPFTDSQTTDSNDLNTVTDRSTLEVTPDQSARRTQYNGDSMPSHSKWSFWQASQQAIPSSNQPSRSCKRTAHTALGETEKKGGVKRSRKSW